MSSPALTHRHTFSNPHDPPNWDPSKNPSSSKNFQKPQKTKFQKFLSTKYSSLFSLSTFLGALDLFNRNFIKPFNEASNENPRPVGMYEAAFRVFVFLQMLVRFVKCVYVNRPVDRKININLLRGF